jgi:Fe-S cluster assembly protein SufD
MIDIAPTQAAPKTDASWEQFEGFARTRIGQEPGWLTTLRKAGIARFAETGFPTVQDEDWRFTNVSALAKLSMAPLQGRSMPTPGAISGLAFHGLDALKLVFVNGHFVPELSSPVPQHAGITVTSLSAAAGQRSEILERHLGRHAQIHDNAFLALNTAFFTDGALVHVAAGQSMDRPIVLIHVGNAAGATAHVRHLIIAEANSRVTVLEHYVSTTPGAHFTNVVTELVAEEGAQIEHCKFQDEGLAALHMAAIHVELARSANVIAHSFALGARLSRNNIRTILGGEGVECILNGLYLTKDDQLADHHMIVDHAKPHCNSHEYFNGILDGRSRGVFHGRILVRPDAQKTDAKQTNKNILLSDDAGVNTKPQLEIYADDVKCTHGATIGQLNEESVFYLRARGIGHETARRMLMHAFAGEIIERIRDDSVREALDKLVWDRLEQNKQIAVHS